MSDTAKKNPYQIFFEQVRDGVYVVARDSYTLLYENAAIQEMFGAQQLGRAKCYKVMWGLDAPCPDCRQYRRSDGLPLLDRSVDGRDFHIERILIDWDGIPAIAVRCADMTSKLAAERQQKKSIPRWKCGTIPSFV